MLDALTTELVEHIVGFLDNRSDLLSVRLVCRQLYLKSFTTFATAWFHTVVSDLTPQSLRRLETIAHHEKIRVFVQKLRIDYCGKSYQGPLGRGNDWPRNESGCLDPSSSIARTLHDWLATRLVRCREFEVADGCGRLPEKDSTDTSLSPTDAVQLLFFAIAAGDGLPVRSFRVHLDRCTPMNPSQLSPGTLNSRPFRSLWASHLQDLELSWVLEQDGWFEAVLDLIITATHLKTLRLRWPACGTTDTQQFIHRLAEAPTVPALTDLKLGLYGISHATLSNLLLRFKGSLTSLYIRHSHLASGTWGAVFRHLRQNDFSHLECITSFGCKEDPRPGYVFFCPLRQKPIMVQNCGGTFEFTTAFYGSRVRVTGVRYRGTGMGMRLALQALEESNYAVYKNGPPSPGCPDQRTGISECLGSLVRSFE